MTQGSASTATGKWATCFPQPWGHPGRAVMVLLALKSSGLERDLPHMWGRGGEEGGRPGRLLRGPPSPGTDTPIEPGPSPLSQLCPAAEQPGGRCVLPLLEKQCQRTSVLSPPCQGQGDMSGVGWGGGGLAKAQAGPPQGEGFGNQIRLPTRYCQNPDEAAKLHAAGTTSDSSKTARFNKEKQSTPRKI